ncbi:uncharacterized protein E6C27_scaffold125G00200 [Cucumis melo var. makuwa]|uniref:Uncharacterized protein n=1 Tax=Cucumis melo var. makuwa TaxID=1194695 RepID=A0A5A7TC38_CUCMM|nr:uncharacterized protein E6C27_scaffold125G00200 [Cucumis melo var. makuwa]
MDKSWMNLRNKLSIEYREGVFKFLNVVKYHIDEYGRIRSLPIWHIVQLVASLGTRLVLSEGKNSAQDLQNIRLGLAFDEFNPFGHMSTAYSMWPVVLIPYSLPPWKCTKESNFFISLLIPGSRSPGRKIDVYLQPLSEELKQLWSLGICRLHDGSVECRPPPIVLNGHDILEQIDSFEFPKVRPLGATSIRSLSQEKKRQIHWYILNNVDKIVEYRKYETLKADTLSASSVVDLFKRHQQAFPDWLRDQCRWFDMGKNKNHRTHVELGYKSINTSLFWFLEEPVILAILDYTLCIVDVDPILVEIPIVCNVVDDFINDGDEQLFVQRRSSDDEEQYLTSTMSQYSTGFHESDDVFNFNVENFNTVPGTSSVDNTSDSPPLHKQLFMHNIKCSSCGKSLGDRTTTISRSSMILNRLVPTHSEIEQSSARLILPLRPLPHSTISESNAGTPVSAYPEDSQPFFGYEICETVLGR